MNKTNPQESDTTKTHITTKIEELDTRLEKQLFWAKAQSRFGWLSIPLLLATGLFVSNRIHFRALNGSERIESFAAIFYGCGVGCLARDIGVSCIERGDKKAASINRLQTQLVKQQQEWNRLVNQHGDNLEAQASRAWDIDREVTLLMTKSITQ
jgi:hypothetical protein